MTRAYGTHLNYFYEFLRSFATKQAVSAETVETKLLPAIVETKFLPVIEAMKLYKQRYILKEAKG